MIKFLEDNKTIKVEDGKITASVEVKVYDKHEVRHEVLEGVATLKEGDTSNELEATRIAEAKMERRYYKVSKRFYKEKLKLLMEEVAETENQIAKIENRIYNCDKHIKDICDRL